MHTSSSIDLITAPWAAVARTFFGGLLFLSSLAVLPVHGQGGFPTFDPLAKSSAGTPAVSFSESRTEKLNTIAPSIAGDPVMYEVGATETSSFTITANLPADFLLTDVDDATSVSVSFGALSFTGTLADDPSYRVGKTSAFLPANTDINGKAIGSNGLKLSWTAKKLTITGSRSLTDVTDAGAIAIGDHLMEPDPAIRSTLPVGFGFGSVSAVGHIVFYTGKSTLTTQMKDTDGDGITEPFDLHSVSLSGAAEYAAPVLTLDGPKSGSQVGAEATVFGQFKEDHNMTDGPGGIGAGPSTGGGFQAVILPYSSATPWDVILGGDSGGMPGTAEAEFESESLDPDLPWGPLVGSWSVACKELNWGTNYLHVWAEDGSGNRSTPLVVQLIRPIPRPLVGRWDGLMGGLETGIASAVDGSVTVTFSANGAYTGKLTYRSSVLPFSGLPTTGGLIHQYGVLIIGGVATLIEMTMTLPAFDSSVGVAAMEGQMAEYDPSGLGGRELASILAVRCPWSTTTLASSKLAGRFHLGATTPGSTSGPPGASYLIATTTRAGSATISGRMADGSVITWSGIMGLFASGTTGGAAAPASGFTSSIPFYSVLYSGKGVVMGWNTISASSDPLMPGGTSLINASLSWIRGANVGDQFTSGFALELQGSGEKYLPPASGVRVFGLTTGAPTTSVAASGDGISAGPLSFDVTVNANNSVTPPSPNTSVFSMSITSSTGLISGGFNLPGTSVKASYNMLIVGSGAVGHYIAPALSGTTQKRYGTVSVLGGGGP